MLFDWFTFGAQVLNFLILVWVMKRFLYKPIRNAIDAREARIAKELADAAASKAEAQSDREEFERKNEEFDTQRAELLGKAADEAHAERERLIDEAREAADALSAKRQEALKNDARSLEEAISRRAQHEVFEIARKALADLASTSLEGRMVEAFVERVRGMDDCAKTCMGKALTTASEPARVRTVVDLSHEQREAIGTAINETFSADIHLRFDTAPELVSGIDLSSNGQRVGWTIDNYLTSLEKGVRELLSTKTDPMVKSEVAPEPGASVDPKPDGHDESSSDSLISEAQSP